MDHGWIRQGDCLGIMKGMDDACVDLIYLDPPFNKGRKFETSEGEFDDRWNGREREELPPCAPQGASLAVDMALACHGGGMAAYTAFIGGRLIEMNRILKKSGSLYFHCDDTASAFIRMLLDSIMGKNAFRSQIIWKRSNPKNNAMKAFGRVYDVIFHYGKEDSEFKPLRKPLDPEYIRKSYTMDDGDGRGPYRLAPLMIGNSRYHYNWKGFDHPSHGWTCPESTMRKFDERGIIHYPRNADGSLDHGKRIAKKVYLSESSGSPVGNLWTDINFVQRSSSEAHGYPTQKPLALLERILHASTEEGDLVFDPFCGSGTTLAAAAAMNRNFAGCDINHDAASLAMDRVEKAQAGIC